jgi:hypothetical protein
MNDLNDEKRKSKDPFFRTFMSFIKIVLDFTSKNFRMADNENGFKFFHIHLIVINIKALSSLKWLQSEMLQN